MILKSDLFSMIRLYEQLYGEKPRVIRMRKAVRVSTGTRDDLTVNGVTIGTTLVPQIKLVGKVKEIYNEKGEQLQ